MPFSPFKGFFLFFCGVCMGMADLVPGISGGTVAFIMGFYSPLLESIKSFNYETLHLLLKGQIRAFCRQIAWRFLLPLLSGVIVSFVLMASLIQALLEHPLYRSYLYAAFLGLVLGSFFFCIKQIKKWQNLEYIGLGLGLMTAFFFTYPRSTQEPVLPPYAIKFDLTSDTPRLNNYNYQEGLLTGLSGQALSVLRSKGIVQTDTAVYSQEGKKLGTVAELMVPFHIAYWDGWLIFCGAIAICALLLPGISGSYLLTLMGVYPLVIGALVDWMASLKAGGFDLEAFLVLLNLGVGILIGAALFSRLLSWLLKTYPDVSLATLSGFMIGALPSVWPFWTYQYALLPLKLEKGVQLIPIYPILPFGYTLEFFGVVLAAIGGLFVVLGIEYLAFWKLKHPPQKI